MIQHTVLLLLLLGVVNSESEFPTNLDRCQAGDTKCLTRVINKIFSGHPAGIPEIGLGSLDPFLIGTTELSHGNQGPISINITMKHASVIGWKRLQVNKVIGFDKDPRSSKFELETYVPVESIVGKYSISGQVLVLPLRGKGLANITIHGVGMNVKLSTKVETRNNEDYLKVKSVNVVVTSESVNFNFTNLFNNKELSDNMNRFLNENQHLVAQEIRPSIAQSFKVILTKFIPPIFETLPYRHFFLEHE